MRIVVALGLGVVALGFVALLVFLGMLTLRPMLDRYRDSSDDPS